MRFRDPQPMKSLKFWQFSTITGWSKKKSRNFGLTKPQQGIVN
jgi:hypothetical protein